MEKNEIIEALKSISSQQDQLKKDERELKNKLFESLYAESEFKAGDKVLVDGTIVFIGEVYLSLYKLGYIYYEVKKDGEMSRRRYDASYGAIPTKPPTQPA